MQLIKRILLSLRRSKRKLLWALISILIRTSFKKCWLSWKKCRILGWRIMSLRSILLRSIDSLLHILIRQIRGWRFRGIPEKSSWLSWRSMWWDLNRRLSRNLGLKMCWSSSKVLRLSWILSNTRKKSQKWNPKTWQSYRS